MESVVRKMRRGRFTYADYLTWPDDERWELIEGEAHDMTPAPSTTHQRTLGAFYFQMRQQLDMRRCEVFPAPFDVRLPQGDAVEDAAVESVVQPDLSVICDPEKIDERGCLGSPDLVVEILSPSTAYKDQTHKLALYEKHGVAEVWLVNAVRGTVLVYVLDGERYGKAMEMRRDEALQARAVPDLVVDLGAVFETR